MSKQVTIQYIRQKLILWRTSKHARLSALVSSPFSNPDVTLENPVLCPLPESKSGTELERTV